MLRVLMVIIVMLSILAVSWLMIVIYVDFDQPYEWMRFWTKVDKFINSSTYVFGATNVHTTTIGSNTYAIVTARINNGVQIIDITNPEMPTPVSKVVDDSVFRLEDIGSLFDQAIRILSGTTIMLRGAEGVHTTTIGSNMYAIVTNSHGIQIIDITNPEMPTPVSKVVDDTTLLLDNAQGVHTTTIGSNMYAIVTSNSENGIQIIDITNPEMPTPVSKVVDDTTLLLDNAQGVHTTTIGSNMYAIVTNSHGIQIIDITNPEMPTPVSKVVDDTTLLLDNAQGVHTTTIGSNMYAIVTSYSENGIQIIDITNPEMPTPVSKIVDDTTLLLDNAQGVHTTTIGSNMYAIVTSYSENGIQIIDITNPEMPTPVSKVVDDDLEYLFLGAKNVHTTTIGSNTYAIVTSYLGWGLLIIDITNPEMPILIKNIHSDTPINIFF